MNPDDIEEGDQELSASSSNQDSTKVQHDEKLVIADLKDTNAKPRRASIFEKTATADEMKMRLTKNEDANVPGNNESEDTIERTVSVPNPVPQCPSPEIRAVPRGSKTWRAVEDMSSSAIYRSRYPSTMQSWDLGGGSARPRDPHDSIDFTAQWNELTALSSSFSLS